MYPVKGQRYTTKQVCSRVPLGEEQPVLVVRVNGEERRVRAADACPDDEWLYEYTTMRWTPVFIKAN